MRPPGFSAIWAKKHPPNLLDWRALNRTTLMTLCAKVWPNGEFSISVKKKMRVRPAKRLESTGVLAGFYNAWIQDGTWAGWRSHFLSARAASEKLMPGYLDAAIGEVCALGLADVSNSPTRAKRGSNGLTGYARKMIRNCAAMLSKRCPRYCAGMITVTLPPMLDDDYRAAVNNWAEIMRQFLKWISRRLEAAGACPWIVGCCEIQEERRARYGGLPLHAHLLINSRVGKDFVFDKEEISSKWNVIVRRVAKIDTAYNWELATRIETVTKNAENYLSKYISKGIKNPGQVMESEGFNVPAGWWYAFGGIKEQIKKSIRHLNEDDSSFLFWLWRNCDYALRYKYDVGVERDGGAIPVAWVGRLNHKGWVMLRAVWFQKAVRPDFNGTTQLRRIAECKSSVGGPGPDFRGCSLWLQAAIPDGI